MVNNVYYEMLSYITEVKLWHPQQYNNKRKCKRYFMLPYHIEFFFHFQVTSSPNKSPSGGMGSPRGVSKTTVLAVSVVAIVSVVYAGCSQEPNIHIIIFIPQTINLRKF